MSHIYIEFFIQNTFFHILFLFQNYAFILITQLQHTSYELV